jgi:hypothetical protein
MISSPVEQPDHLAGEVDAVKLAPRGGGVALTGHIEYELLAGRETLRLR